MSVSFGTRWQVDLPPPEDCRQINEKARFSGPFPFVPWFSRCHPNIGKMLDHVISY